MSQLRIVPADKHDLTACKRLALASDAEVLVHIRELLTWLQDMNWPVARPIAARVATLGPGLAAPIREILHGDDDVWKYGVVTALLPASGRALVAALAQALDRILVNPSMGETREGVVEAVRELRGDG